MKGTSFLSRGLYVALALCMVLALSAFGGCASDAEKGTNPQVNVYGWQQKFNQALHVADWYGKLSFCDAPVHEPICADRAVVLKIEQAVLVAEPSVKAAQATVRNPAFDESTASQIELSAAAAVAVLTTITDPLIDLFTRAVAEGKAQPFKASMQASPTWDGSMVSAGVELASLLYILNLLRALMRTVPEGTAAWRRWKAAHDKVEGIVQRGKDNPDDENAGKPTDDEWADLNAETDELVESIKANADRARDPSA